MKFDDALTEYSESYYELPPYEKLVLQQEFPRHENLIDPSLRVYLLRNVLIDKYGYIKLHDGTIIDSGYPHDKSLSYNGFKGKMAEGCSIIDSAVLVHGHNQYYHWHMNWLPRIFLSEKFQVTHQSKILIPKSPSSFIYSSLRKFLPHIEERLQTVEEDHYFVKELFVPSLFLNPMHSPFLLRNINATRSYPTMVDKKIYITREKSSYRKVINEGELVEFLLGRGFEVFEAENLAYEDQIEIFSRSKVVVTPHGAGLTNLIFSSPDVSVVELSNQYYTKVFWSLNLLVGGKHYYILQSQNTRDPKKYRDEVERVKNSDFYVDIKALEVILDKFE